MTSKICHEDVDESYLFLDGTKLDALPMLQRPVVIVHWHLGK